MIDINKLREKITIKGLNVVADTDILVVLDRLEEAESECLEEARLNGMGSEREAALMAKLEAAEKERDALRTALSDLGVTADEARAGAARSKAIREDLDALRAELDALMAQEPVAWDVYIPSQQTSEVFDSQDDPGYIDWLTNYEDAKVTPLYANPVPASVPDFSDAYQGAMEEVAIWKRRALEAKELNRKFIAEINGPTHIGEPVPASVPEKLCYDSRWEISIDYVDGWNAAIDMMRGKSPSWHCPDCCIAFPFGQPKACPHDDGRCNALLSAASKQEETK